MLLKDTRVKIPDKCKIQGKYVYYVRGTKYIKDKKYNVDDRVIIGKMIKDDKDHMIPNDNFHIYFPDTSIDIEDIDKISNTLKVGNFCLIDKIIKDSGIDKLLDEIFPSFSDLIKDLSFYMIVKEDSTIQHFPVFFFDHPSFSKKVYSDSYISSIFKNSLDKEDIDIFLKAWSKLNNDDTKIYVSYDSTNMTTDAKGIELARFGHCKDNEDKPQVNIAYAIRHKDSLPLVYELYDGSIIDNSECRYIIERMQEYGLKNLGLILDRGYFSKKNMDLMIKKGYDFILAIKESTALMKEAINEKGLTLKNSNKHYLIDHDVYGLSIKKELYGHIIYLHLYYDNVRAQKERNAYLKRIAELEKQLDKKLEAKIKRKEDLRSYEKLFNLHFDLNGFFISYSRKEAYIDRVINNFGYFALVSSNKISNDEALSNYRDRDVVEKMFRSIKSYLDYDSFGVYYDETLIAKTFIVFIASIIRSKIHHYTKDLYKTDKKNFTVPSILRELEKVEVTKNIKGIYHRTSAINAKNKKTLKVFNIDEKYIDHTAYKYTINFK